MEESAEGLYSFSVSFSHSHMNAHLCRSPGAGIETIIISGQELHSHKDQCCCSETMERRLQPTETIGLGLEKGGKEDAVLWAEQAKQGRTTAGSRLPKSYSHADFPCELYFPILHPSIAHHP